MHPERIASACLKGFPGADRALVDLGRSTGLTDHVRLASPRPDGPEVRFLAAELREKAPPALILGGWSPVYETLVRAVADARTRVCVYWTSSGGQVDISQEAPKLSGVLAHASVSTLLFSSAELARGFAATGRDARHLPITLEAPAVPADRRSPDAVPALSLFCAATEHRRKNVLNCLLALGRIDAPCRLHLNGLSQDPAYGAILDALRIDYCDSGWMSPELYAKTLASVDLGLQLSFAESYGYVVADHLVRGIPVLVSPMVPVVDLLSERTRRELVVTEADRPSAIARRIRRLLESPALRAETGAGARRELLRANEKSVAGAREVLRALAAPADAPERVG